MEKLIVDPQGSTLFARLVALRIKLSQFLSSLNYNLDRNYQRLLQQQTLCIRALKKKINPELPWYNTQYTVPVNTVRKFNTYLGRY